MSAAAQKDICYANATVQLLVAFTFGIAAARLTSGTAVMHLAYPEAPPDTPFKISLTNFHKQYAPSIQPPLPAAINIVSFVVTPAC